MVEDRSEDIEKTIKRWADHAKRYDQWYETFEGAVEHHVEWELLKGYLPQNPDAQILDAAGGTGRITLPLAKMGYSVTLCDISPAMLDVARQKMLREEVLDKVEILECDVRQLRFADESFDFVLCWDGMFEAAKELIRVIKRGGKISIFLMNRCGAAISKFGEDPDAALALLRSKSDDICHDEDKHRAVSAEEARKFFAAEGIRVIDIFAVCGWLDVLPIPEKVRESGRWDDKFFRQTTEMAFSLSKEPSVQGISRHLVLYGEKM